MSSRNRANRRFPVWFSPFERSDLEFISDFMPRPAAPGPDLFAFFLFYVPFRVNSWLLLMILAYFILNNFFLARTIR